MKHSISPSQVKAFHLTYLKVVNTEQENQESWIILHNV